ncbi:MAG: phosphatase PAP2 family protein [Clostridium sp.]|nr:phosphatase PAP2 family protein [Clostridium sp.]
MDAIQNLDNSILQFIQNNLRNDVLDSIMPVITSMGNGGFIWIVICAILLFSKRYRKYGFIMIIALILCAVIGNLSLKPLVARTRPFNAKPLIDGLLIKAPKDYSFPSGHTMVSFSCTAVLYYMNKKIGISALIVSSAIAFSRLYLYVHYPSDVFVGIIIGVLIACISIKLYFRIEKRSGLIK